jgi:hypothetical protein
MPSDWKSGPCATTSTPRWRYWEDGRIEVESVGFPKGPQPKAIAGAAKWMPMILAASAKYKIPPHWIGSIMAIESGGKVDACSPCSACCGEGCCAHGLMQTTLGTGQAMAKRLGLPVPSGAQMRSNGELSIALGVRYLSGLLTDEQGFIGKNLTKGDFVIASAAYNAGGVKCGVVNKRDAAGNVIGPCAGSSRWNMVMDCTSEYPMWGIGYVNDAVAAGWPIVPGASLPGPPPLPVPQGLIPPTIVAEIGAGAAAAIFIASGVLAFYVTREYRAGRLFA